MSNNQVKKSKFIQSLTLDNKSIKEKRAVLLETTFNNELDKKISNLRSEKIEQERVLSTLMDFNPLDTTSLTFGNIKNGGEDASRVLTEYHNAQMRIELEIKPSLKIFEDLKKNLFSNE